MGVASLVFEAGGDEDLAIAALLHDVVEDCGGAPMLKEVRRRFGARVAKVVDGCTDADTDPKPPWRERKEKYIARLRKEDEDTRLVSAADKLNNVRSIISDYRAVGESVWSRFNGGREGTLWYYRTLRDEFLRHPPNRITRDLALAVSELESLAAGHTEGKDLLSPQSRCEAMARMIDQIRASKLPSNMMQFAARGALQVPAAENIEILVYLAQIQQSLRRVGAHDLGRLG